MCSTLGPEVEENKGVTFRVCVEDEGAQLHTLGRVAMKSMVKEVGRWWGRKPESNLKGS